MSKPSQRNAMESREAILREAEKALQQIVDSGVAENTIVEQMQRFRSGFPFTRLIRPCTPGDGIMLVPAEVRSRLVSKFRQAVDEGRVTKFVPASGAATRMFKSLLALYSRDDNPLSMQGDDADSRFGRDFFASLDKFAFYDELKRMMVMDGISLSHCLDNGEYWPVLNYVLTSKGLNYSHLPKG